MPRQMADERRLRVFIEAWYVGKIFKPERASEPMEEMAAFAQECPQAVATTNKEKADYVLRLEHHSGVRVSEKNFYRYSLFDREGSQIAAEASPELGGAVGLACKAVLSNSGSKNR